MRKFYFISFAFILALIGFGIILGGRGFGWYIDIPSLVMIILPMFFIPAAAYGVTGTGKAFSLPFREDVDRKELLHAENIFRTLRRTVWLTGVIALLIGNIAMLGNIELVSGYTVGLGVAILAFFYSLSIDLVIVTPYLMGIRRRLIDLDQA